MGLRRRKRVVLEEEHRLVRVKVMTIRRKNKRGRWKKRDAI